MVQQASFRQSFLPSAFVLTVALVVAIVLPFEAEPTDSSQGAEIQVGVTGASVTRIAGGEGPSDSPQASPPLALERYLIQEDGPDRNGTVEGPWLAIGVALIAGVAVLALAVELARREAPVERESDEPQLPSAVQAEPHLLLALESVKNFSELVEILRSLERIPGVRRARSVGFGPDSAEFELEIARDVDPDVVRKLARKVRQGLETRR